MTINFSFEKKLWKKGFKIVAGCDEVGRGCLAGPVVCGCVVFRKSFSKKDIPGEIVIDDSKKLSSKQREISNKWIKKNSYSWGIGKAEVNEINRIGMAKATRTAFRRAIKNSNIRLQSMDDKNSASVDFLLIDAFYLPFTKGLKIPRKKVKSKKNKALIDGTRKLEDKNARQIAIINGDEKSISIASASIVAKVYRDRLMSKLSREKKYSMYGWEKNKGYGTRNHIEAIKKHKPSKYHRKQFISKIV